MAAKTTYAVTLPDGEVRTRTSAAGYTYARVLDWGTYSDGWRYLVTFHRTRELADRKHSDYPTMAWTVMECQVV